MDQLGVPMDVCVRLFHRVVMLMRVVCVVNVRVVVLKFPMFVKVIVAGPEKDDGTNGHDTAGTEFNCAYPLIQDRDGGQGPDEGRGREVGPLAGRPDVPHRQEVEDDAQPVTKEAGEEHPAERRCGRQALPQGDRQSHVDHSCYQRLHARDGDGVPQRKPLAEIVVERPGGAGAHDGEGAR